MKQEEKEICKCRKCSRMFNQKEVKRSKTMFGIQRGCPYCGSTNYGLLVYPADGAYRSKSLRFKYT